MNNDAQIARDTAKADLERQERQVILLCYFYGSRQDCSTSIANALEFTKCLHQAIEVEWCRYAPVNKAIFGSAKGLLPIWCQAIIWTNAELLLTGPVGTNFRNI